MVEKPREPPSADRLPSAPTATASKSVQVNGVTTVGARALGGKKWPPSGQLRAGVHHVCRASAQGTWAYTSDAASRPLISAIVLGSLCQCQLSEVVLLSSNKILAPVPHRRRAP